MIEHLNYIAPYVLKATRIEVKHNTIHYIDEYSNACFMDLNTFALSCIDYCLALGFEFNTVKSRFDSLWFIGIDEFEFVGGTEWIPKHKKFVYTLEDTEYTNAVFQATEWVIKHKFWGEK